MTWYIVRNIDAGLEILESQEETVINPKSPEAMCRLERYARDYGLNEVRILQEIPIKYRIEMSPIDD